RVGLGAVIDLANPALGSAVGWPLVLYFHHVHDEVRHYTALSRDAFRRGIELVLDTVGPAVEPATVGLGFEPPDRSSVLFTFDDGYRDTVTSAAPILAEYDVRVLLFCVTDEVDAASGRSPGERAGLAPRQDYLTWDEVAELEAAGHVASAHTRTHPKLPTLDTDRARTEVIGSLERVRQHTGQTPTTFAYPYGLVPEHPVLPKGVLGFGTVKSAAVPWLAAPHRVRRTYLPVDGTDRWQSLATGWRRQWFGSQ
ncbi:MAG TPA: polysaccharide deacetylase family protein, partial [Pseudonocardiaceae bacterium]